MSEYFIREHNPYWSVFGHGEPILTLDSEEDIQMVKDMLDSETDSLRQQLEAAQANIAELEATLEEKYGKAALHKKGMIEAKKYLPNNLNSAIKVYREITGVDLTTALYQVDGFRRHDI